MRSLFHRVGFHRAGSLRLGLALIAALAGGQLLALAQLDTSVLANPHSKRTLQIDQTRWQTQRRLSPEARARVTATVAQHRAAKAAAPAADRKVSPLLRAYQRVSRTPQAGARAFQMRRQFPMLGVEPDGAVRVRLRVRDTSASSLSRLRALGVRVAHVHADNSEVSGAVAAEQLDRIAASNLVTKIAPIVGAIVHAGAVTTEGVAAHRVDRVSEQLGVTGKRARIGVISDGIAHIDSPASTGDIPVDAEGNADVDLCPLNDNDGDEGTAMLEIVHDIAPAAKLAFCPAFSDAGEQGLADAVTWLATKAFNGKGAQIIVDDVGYLTEPFFQDGVIARAVDAAAKDGVIYFSSAGNGADAHYELPYTDVVPGDQPFPLDAHDFAQAQGSGSDIFWGGIVAGAGNFFAAFMQWTDPFGHSGNDYDIYIFDQNGFEAGDPRSAFPIGASGLGFQNGDDDPLEIAFVFNPDGAPPIGTVKPFFMLVDRVSGDPHKLLELNFNGFFAVDPVYSVAEGSIWGHAAARGAIAVAATGAVENLDGTPNPNHDIIEFYSSQGPSRIFFTPAGRPRFESRTKPQFTAVDGVSVTGVNFVNPFFGTSASAPHAAAIAGLLKDVDSSIDPSDAIKILRQTALDRGEPGFDSIWGHGFIDALAATRRAGQVGNSPLYFMCIPGRHPAQIVAPGAIVPALVDLGLEFGKCDR
jgi:hypothetical protein